MIDKETAKEIAIKEIVKKLDIRVSDKFPSGFYNPGIEDCWIVIYNHERPPFYLDCGNELVQIFAIDKKTGNIKFKRRV
jgi:hypothetical protein